MGKPTGFLEFERNPMPARKPDVRIADFYEIYERADAVYARRRVRDRPFARGDLSTAPCTRRTTASGRYVRCRELFVR